MLLKSCKFMFSLLIFGISPSGMAAGNLSVNTTIAVNGSAADVWAEVGDFGGIDNWHPAVISAEITSGNNNEAGAVRLLTLGDGGTIEEKLLALDDSGMVLKYAIIQGVLPVSDYTSTISVEAIDDASSRVTWSGSFNAGAGADDATAHETITGVYQAGLENLAGMFE